MDTFDSTIVAGKIGRDLDERLSPLVQDVLRSHEIPGLAIGAVVDNEIAYARGFGVRSVDTREAVSAETLFHMASISKPFVATAIMQLVEAGRIDIEAPIITYLPYFTLDDERYKDITVQQMLSHVSGMPDVEDYEWTRPEYGEGALERYVRSLSSQKLIAEPGEKYAYSNMAFECLGDVIAKVSGMPFADYVKRHILNPAGMAQSTFAKPEHLPADWAAPHVWTMAVQAWEGYPYNRIHEPSSTLHSNALEMCHWAIANLNRGAFEGRQILRPSSYDTLWKPWAVVGEGQSVGLSWFFEEYRGERTVEHGGGDVGFRTQFIMLPDKRAAAVVLCNLIPAPVEKIAEAALDIVLGYVPEPIVPYAGLTVFKTLREAGLDAAVAEWDALKSQHPADYNFSRAQFSSLLNAVSLDRVEDADSIARLCVRVLPESDVHAVEAWLGGCQNRAATLVRQAFREHGDG